MRATFVRLALAALAAAWLAPPAHGQATLTSGNATFTLNAVPTNENSATYSNVTFRPEGGTTTNHLYSQWLFYRVAGDTRERPLGTYTRSDGGTVSLSGSASADTMTYAIAESAVSVTRYTGTWTLQLQDGVVPGAATVLHTVTITNPTASSLSLSLFHYLDYDLTGNFSNSASGDLSGMTITGGGMAGTYKPLTIATHFQASSGSPTLDVGLLDGNVTNLADSGLPMANDDWTGAYQWDLVIAPGGSATIQFEMGVSPVPEPGSVLALAAVGLVGWAVRRRQFHERGGSPS